MAARYPAPAIAHRCQEIPDSVGLLPLSTRPSLHYLEPMRDALSAPRSDSVRGVAPAAPDAADASLYADRLYWSRRGEIACLLHAPERNSPRWPQEQWAAMSMMAIHRHGIKYQCQHCSASGRPIARRRVDRRSEESVAPLD